jgi:hypothetical protein
MRVTGIQTFSISVNGIGGGHSNPYTFASRHLPDFISHAFNIPVCDRDTDSSSPTVSLSAPSGYKNDLINGRRQRLHDIPREQQGCQARFGIDPKSSPHAVCRSATRNRRDNTVAMGGKCETDLLFGAEVHAGYEKDKIGLYARYA